MGEYTGRRRGRAASEPSAQQPEYAYGEQPYADPYAQPQYGHEQPAPEYQGQGYEYAPEYVQEPGYSYQEAPGYEQYPSYEQQPGYEQQGYTQEYQQEYQADYAEGYAYPEQDQQEGYHQEGYAPEGYQQEPSQQQPYYEEPYAEPSTPGYSPEYTDVYDPRDGYDPDAYDPNAYDPNAYYPDTHGSPDAYDGYDTYEGYDTPEPRSPALSPLSPLSHLPYSAAATAALAVAAFVSTKAIAAVVLPLQLVVAYAVLDLAGFASRRTAVLVALPGLAGVLGTFKFQPDDAALPLAAGLGAGFVLVAADAVFRARRRGVEPGSVASLAASASALLFSGLTGLFLPAAVLHTESVAAGAAVCALASLLAARSRELGASRAAVVAIPVTIAALASYAAAILVP